MNETPIDVPWGVVVGAPGTSDWLVQVFVPADGFYTPTAARDLAAAIVAAADEADAKNGVL
jgi:hypothetical protein